MLIHSAVPSYSYKVQEDRANDILPREKEPTGLYGDSQGFSSYVDKQTPEEILKAITENGITSLWQWQMEELKKKVAADIMAEMGITPEQLAAMPDTQRMSLEAKIMQEVERRIKDMVAENMRKKDESGLAGNIKLDAQTQAAMIELTQGLTEDYLEVAANK